MNYKIEIKETLSRVIDIETKNEEKAIIKIGNLYRNENSILDNTDYVETNFNIINY